MNVNNNKYTILPLLAESQGSCVTLILHERLALVLVVAMLIRAAALPLPRSKYTAAWGVEWMLSQQYVTSMSLDRHYIYKHHHQSVPVYSVPSPTRYYTLFHRYCHHTLSPYPVTISPILTVLVGVVATDNSWVRSCCAHEGKCVNAAAARVVRTRQLQLLKIQTQLTHIVVHLCACRRRCRRRCRTRGVMR